MQLYRTNPYALVDAWSEETSAAANEIVEARGRLAKVTLTREVERLGLGWIKRLGIDSHRTEITLFEAARAHAAADGRTKVNLRDLRAVAPLALRQRRSQFMNDYFAVQSGEDKQISRVVRSATKAGRA